jgi:hypothetical protein
VTSATSPAPSRASSGGSAGAGSGTAATATAGRTGFGGLLASRGNRRPGDLAVMVALGLAIVSAVYLLSFYKVSVDDRGEPLPPAFQAVALAAREAITGQELPDNEALVVDAYGPGILFIIALPVVVAAFAFWANRRPNRRRALTYTLVAMAVAVLFSGGVGPYYFPSLIALAVASFQIRRTDMPARVAERVAPTRGRRGVIDAESEELDDEPVDDGVDGLSDEGAGDVDSARDEGGDRAASDEGGDPLAELEAELEAEERSRRGGGGDPSRGSTPEE